MTSLLNIAGNIPVVEAGGQSLRFEDGDSAYLSWTPASSGSQQKFTFSSWHKLGKLQSITTNEYYFSAGDNFRIGFLSNATLYVQTSSTTYFGTSEVFRDHSAWYHIVWAVDTTASDSTNRVKVYVNGVQITSWDYSVYPSQNANLPVNTSSYTFRLGNAYISGSNYFYDGYIANACFIDGQQLDPTSFGEYDGTLWKPKSDADIQSLTFGTNGFYLPFKQTTEAEGFSTVTYTGNGGTQSIEGVGFEPSLVWIKSRSFANNHHLFDSVRGAGKILRSSTTDAESTLNVLSSFDSSGFTVAETGGNNATNDAGSTFVAWCWDAGTGSAVSNTDGSITSSVKANTAKGFSVVSYTSNASGQDTVGHGLTSAPEMIITKSRDGGTFNWSVYHASVCDTTSKYLSINNTNALSAYSTIWGAALPTSSVFGITSGGGVEASDACIAYCFHSVSGYSSIGSYTGTGASGNSITGLGFKPAWVMVKRYDGGTNGWMIYDNTRNPVDDRTLQLQANTSNAEATTSGMSFDSDGFTLKDGGNGTNGSGASYIYMAFADTRDATFFGDTSGNGNNWTPNALNNTDVVPDSPVTGGNFAVLNALAKGTSTTLSEGNLKFTSAQNYAVVLGSIGVTSGKWYWEGLPTTTVSSNFFGIGSPSTNVNTYLGLNDDFGYAPVGWIYGPNDASSQTGLATYSAGDIIGVAMDMDAGEVKFYKNNTLVTTVTSVDTSYPRFPAVADNSSASNPLYVVNFGQDSSFAGTKTPQGNTDDNGVGDFYYAPPSGFLALTTGNLPTPSITAPDEYFNTVLYTGDGVDDRAITGVGFQPDWVWLKTRSVADNHVLNDSVRGGNRQLFSNTTDQEFTSTSLLKTFDSDGFTLGTDSAVNGSGRTLVAWNWLAGGTAVSNTDGSITSQVSANTDAGFSVVSYTGTGANATVGHGLSSAPDVVIVKNRDSTTNWNSFWSPVGATKWMTLNTTNAAQTASTLWNDTAPTSSVFSLGTSTSVNTTNDYIAYCFHSVEGYSKIGSYTGNGSADGTYVHCGFRPAFVMVKRTDGANNWLIQHNKSLGYNPSNSELYANLTNAEATADRADFLSNGFKARINSTENNGSGASYIFIAFAEAPFKSANAR